MADKSRMRAINVEKQIRVFMLLLADPATNPQAVNHPRALSNPSLEGCIRRMILGTRFRGGLVEVILNTPLTHQGGLADRRRPRGRHTAKPTLLHGHGLYRRPLCLGLAGVLEAFGRIFEALEDVLEASRNWRCSWGSSISQSMYACTADRRSPSQNLIATQESPPVYSNASLAM